MLLYIVHWNSYAVVKNGEPPPPSRLPGPWSDKGEAIWTVPLVRAEGGEEEAQVSLVATEDGSPPVAEAMVRPVPPDAALVVDVISGLETCNMMEQANSALVQPAHGVGHLVYSRLGKVSWAASLTGRA